MSIIKQWQLMLRKWKGEYTVFPGSRMLSEDERLIMNRYHYTSRFVSGRRVLEIGCNVGIGADYLAREGAIKVVGGDISQEAINYAAGTYKSGNNLEFVLLDADAPRLPFVDDCFDVIVALEVIEHLKKAEGFILECARVLRKKDSVLIIATPNGRMSLVKARQHQHEFTIGELRPLLNTAFANVNLYTDGFGTNYTSRFGRNRIRLVRLLRQAGTRVLEIVPRGENIKWFVAKHVFHLTTVMWEQTISDDNVDDKFELLPLEDGKLRGEPIRLYAIASP